MRHHATRVLLEVVRRQVVFFGGDEGLEESPGATRDQPQFMLLSGVQFRSGGGTILLTTHYMDEAEFLCDRVAIVDQGRIIAQGTPKELIAQLGEPKVITHHGTLEDVFMSKTGRHLRDE